MKPERLARHRIPRRRLWLEQVQDRYSAQDEGVRAKGSQTCHEFARLINRAEDEQSARRSVRTSTLRFLRFHGRELDAVESDSSSP